MIGRVVLLFALTAMWAGSSFAESVCFGTTSNGRLENGVRLPDSGSNFKSYGLFPELARRTYVHSVVREIVIESYQLLERELPTRVFKYAETGYKNGGQFKPHKTHQNGLSIDFMVPVQNEAGKSVHLPTHPFNKYGYEIEFDKRGKSGEYQIDFDALGAHIVALHKVARKNKVNIWRVIFDPRLQPMLFRSKHGKYIRKNILIPKKRSWVRHDEHYHVDFRVPCKPLSR